MKNIPLLLFLSLGLAIGISAQTNQDSSCPTVEVRGGGSAVRINETMYFTADVDKKGKDLKIEYVWSVRGGKIIEGQGKKTIAVKASKNDGLSATVEIKGFPEGCSNTYTESVVTDDLKTKAFKIGEFLTFDTPAEKKQLEKLGKKISENADAQVYVVVRFKKKTPAEKVSEQMNKAGFFLMKEFKLTPDRIIMVPAFAGKEYTEIWLVPPGADNPKIK